MSDEVGNVAANVPRKTRSRLVLLSAARELYARDGIDETSVEAIAALANVSVGSIYSNFGSKEGLALEVASDALSDLERQLRIARDRPKALDRVRAAGDAYLRFGIAHPALSRYVATRAMSPTSTAPQPGEHARSIDRRLRAALLTTAGDLKEAMDEGQIRRMPIDALTVALWGLCTGVTDMISRRDALAMTPDLAERALRLGTALILTGQPPES